MTEPPSPQPNLFNQSQPSSSSHGGSSSRTPQARRPLAEDSISVKRQSLHAQSPKGKSVLRSRTSPRKDVNSPDPSGGDPRQTQQPEHLSPASKAHEIPGKQTTPQIPPEAGTGSKFKIHFGDNKIPRCADAVVGPYSTEELVKRLGLDSSVVSIILPFAEHQLHNLDRFKHLTGENKSQKYEHMVIPSTD
jgi:hypothetical protein